MLGSWFEHSMQLEQIKNIVGQIHKPKSKGAAERHPPGMQKKASRRAGLI
jgi:hypothetical protein